MPGADPANNLAVFRAFRPDQPDPPPGNGAGGSGGGGSGGGGGGAPPPGPGEAGHEAPLPPHVHNKLYGQSPDIFTGDKQKARCQEAALTRRTSWRHSGEGVGLGPSGKQLHPATPELTAWQEGPADSLQ